MSQSPIILVCHQAGEVSLILSTHLHQTAVTETRTTQSLNDLLEVAITKCLLGDRTWSSPGR